MSSQGELPQWAASAGQPATDYMNTPPPGRKGRRWVFALLSVLALAGMAVGGYLLAGFLDGDSTDTTADPAAPTAAEEETADAEPSGDTAAGDDAASAGTEDAGDQAGDNAGDDTADTDDAALAVEGTTTTAPAEESDEAEENSETGIDASARTAVFRQGKLFLGGAVPSQEVADAIVAKAVAVVGPDNVEADYEIDPTVDFDPGESTPLYVEDVVLFQFNSVAIDPPFIPILDLGVLLLRQNPQASVTVVTRTDAEGSADINLEVATQRATAVLEYWVSKGVDPGQVILDPRGEEGASESDDEQTQATQRRAEFILTNILG